jgi:predicted transcriptional regulator
MTTMKYRSRTDIVSQILESANGGATKTQIMYKVFLNYEQLKEYLVILLRSGLLDYDPKTLRYKTAIKGLQFLKTYNQMIEVMRA